MFNYDITRDYTCNLIANVTRYANMYYRMPTLGACIKAHDLLTLVRRINGVSALDELNMFA